MDPAEERRDRKRKEEYFKMVGYIADSEYGIPRRCACGDRIIDEIGGKEDKDTLPGKLFFTCSNYKADGLHYRQSWVFGVQKEIEKLIKRVKEAEQRVKELDLVMYRVPYVHTQIDTVEAQVKILSDQVSILTAQLTEVEKMLKGVPNLSTLSLH